MMNLDTARGWIMRLRTVEHDTTEDLLDGFAEILDDIERHEDATDDFGKARKLNPCCHEIISDIREDVADALRNAQD